MFLLIILVQNSSYVIIYDLKLIRIFITLNSEWNDTYNFYKLCVSYIILILCLS